ncbi:hypothetical protein BDV33DRAFT_167023 [Aspergillus novoparasiticus]|uniref:ERT1/acuK family PAS domain-containing protein n=1 Tax=Aspergillus novoparasiticus TaxID=986946 RepID=A0A5N6F4W0_9EURO|nr:hypothetical protein BDV33DRAFT_167023 [Aspergillus novoparasiticus]
MSEPVALFGTAYFGTTMLACIIQTIFARFRYYWMINVALAAVREAIGCAYCWTVKRDVFDIPMLIVMNVSF